MLSQDSYLLRDKLAYFDRVQHGIKKNINLNTGSQTRVFMMRTYLSTPDSTDIFTDFWRLPTRIIVTLLRRKALVGNS